MQINNTIKEDKTPREAILDGRFISVIRPTRRAPCATVNV